MPVTKKAYNEMMDGSCPKYGMGINLSPKEQISSGAEVMSQVSLVETMSKVQISEFLTKEDAMARIDKY